MYQEIIKEWKKGNISAINWLEGEESFFIDKLVHFAQHSILTENEKNFNQTVIIGSESSWQSVVMECKRLPVFAERQVVIVKEAQDLDLYIDKSQDFESKRDVFEKYLQNANLQTILIIAYRNKKLDARTKIYKTLKEKFAITTFKKVYENQVVGWVEKLILENELKIESKAIQILIQHTGNDLSAINKQLEKLKINFPKSIEIQKDDILNFIGIHRDYNIFELQNALFKKQFVKLFQIVEFFQKNPKNAPLILILSNLFAAFSKLLIIDQIKSKSNKEVADTIGVQNFFIQDYIDGYNNYKPEANLHKIILVINQYNLKMLGIDSSSIDEGLLLKELISKIIIR